MRPFSAMTPNASKPEGSGAQIDGGVAIANGVAAQVANGAPDAGANMVGPVRVPRRMKMLPNTLGQKLTWIANMGSY